MFDLPRISEVFGFFGHFDECEAVFCQIIVDAVKAVKVRTHWLLKGSVPNQWAVWLVFP
jgi:hypothetical protein